jgi:hypothetical protein
MISGDTTVAPIYMRLKEKLIRQTWNTRWVKGAGRIKEQEKPVTN